ncbi:hypothetical protein BCR33DRAFT_853509 [Rhizoclosmatium globosum]|uniref:Uncharacterized protein n=1 Tax=Rhizoclosmatium globosum TaxID=329046 RepID=A0A1Y2BX85_9FUNG|nr:hypothetical protein BCR33DRAFT_853509 [Rhizoclosmatium globosum]|eukprot:ORY39363.1 hypothetical protein BCR33DRAFT_853509 [Rhizoclosmatium globosum]
MGVFPTSSIKRLHVCCWKKNLWHIESMSGCLLMFSGLRERMACWNGFAMTVEIPADASTILVDSVLGFAMIQAHFKRVKDAPVDPIAKEVAQEKVALDSDVAGRLVSRPMAVRQAIAMGYKTGPKKIVVETPPIVKPAGFNPSAQSQGRKRDDREESDDEQ